MFTIVGVMFPTADQLAYLHCCTVVQLCQGMGQQGCNDSGREQLVAVRPAQLDAQGWDVQQAGLGEGAAEWVEQQGCQGV
ncbi:hypothetical protein HaLaN_07967 [Haematococcus lacustris]|uniref:Uncharacterized protein n=1 Tax=Haematococcus lacustris TaxID=44745 RepID=A0A699YQZ9_HAELA|nr:hypothetical protein HaLaN_07967 [Haematococcus lacustris]